MKKLLFHIKDYQYLADKILASGKFDAGKLEVSHFSDGERYQRILSDIDNRDLVLIGGGLLVMRPPWKCSTWLVHWQVMAQIH